MSLVKVLIDSLNEKQLIIPGDIQTDIKGISKLEKWIKSNEAVGYENHIKFLRDLQKLRSTGSGHRKGKEYSGTEMSYKLYCIVWCKTVKIRKWLRKLRHIAGKIKRKLLGIVR